MSVGGGDGDQQAQISHNFLTNLVGRHRTQASMLDNRWTMTCEYGLQRTGRTLSIDLRIKCLPTARQQTRPGMREAPASEGPTGSSNGVSNQAGPDSATTYRGYRRHCHADRTRSGGRPG